MRSPTDHLELAGVGHLVTLSAGAFLMGNERDVVDWDGNVRREHERNGPERLVEVTRAFAIMDAPVTVGAFYGMGINVPHNAQVHCLPASGDINDQWTHREFSQVNAFPMAPVVGVTWDEAMEFCRVCSKKVGRTIRLPTEIEWEYACRAGTRTLYFWGDDVRSGEQFAWSDRNSQMQVHPVRMKRANPWGLFDMAGNVWEWCSENGEHGTFTGVNQMQPIRGGAACHHATSGRSAHRFEQPRGQRNSFLGFRCVLEVNP